MLRSDIEKKFLKSVKIDNDNDPKKKEIMEWCNYYWKIFEEMPERTIDFIAKKLAENDSWDENKIKKKELDGKIVLPGKTSEENPLTVFVRYEIACCGCNKTYIKNIFEELPSERNKSLTLEDIKSRNKNHLMIFWSHYINKDKLGNHEDFGEKKSYTDGFQYAIKDKNIGAMDFFWKKIKDDLSITNDAKEEICIQPALYRGMNTGSNADMIEFTMKCLDELGDTENRYRKLLKTKEGKIRYLIHKLKREHRFNSAQKLFKSLKPDDVSCEEYTSSMSVLLDGFTEILNTMKLKDEGIDADNFAKLEKNKLLKEGEELLGVMWNNPGFEEQKNHFVKKEIHRQYSAVRNKIASLVKMSDIFKSKTLSSIINLISIDIEGRGSVHTEVLNIVENFKQMISSVPESDTSSSSKTTRHTDFSKLPFLHKGSGDIGNQ